MKPTIWREAAMAVLLAGTALGAIACGACGKEEEAKKALDCVQGTHQEGEKCVANAAQSVVQTAAPAAPQQGTPVQQSTTTK